MDMKSIQSYAKEIHDVIELENDFDIKEVVNGLGGEIEECELNSGIVAQLSDLSDAEGNPKFKIKLSKLIMTEVRRRFSIAHELGHLFIHLDFLDKNKWTENCQDSKLVYYRKEINNGIEEVEANMFAAAFLMPGDKFKDVASCNISNDGSYDIESIAAKFRVSKESAYYRGINLGLWI